MPYEVDLLTPIDAISLSTGETGEQATVQSRGFLTDANGEFFYGVLDGLANLFLKPYIEKGLPVSIIDNLIVLIKGQKATVYINETNIIYQTISKRPIKVYTSVTLDDIVGVISLKFPEITITEEHSIVYYFSIGWKRGLFFDFSPNSGVKLQDVEYDLAANYEYLLYSHIFRVSETVWNQIYELGWFPFIALLGDADKELRHLLSRIEEEKSTEQSEERLVDFFDEEQLSVVHQRIKDNHNPEITPHLPIVEVGIERYLAGDYISSINNIWPRIEGILRYIYLRFYTDRPSQKKLANNMHDVVSKKTLSPGIFFPEQFEAYLLKFYFRNFDLAKGSLQVSRHSTGHGVAEIGSYDKKHALLGILMIDQLSFYLQRPLTLPAES